MTRDSGPLGISESFEEALEAVDSGDVERLERLLDRDPGLVHETPASEEPPYDGYFHHATLLHHVAGNPIRGGLPGNVVDVARILLERGSRVDAKCGGGPSQPASAGGTTLGLVASGLNAERAGLALPLIDLLLEAGAGLDGTMWPALYHTVENQGQREVALYLFEKGHAIDLCYAAGLGLLDRLEAFFDSDGRPLPGSDAVSRRGRGLDTDQESDCDQKLADALLFACVQGRLALADRLVELGAQLDRLRPWGPVQVTPLHGAAWAGWADMVAWLLDAGADPTIEDPLYKSNPWGWAAHCNQHEVVELFQSRFS